MHLPKIVVTATASTPVRTDVFRSVIAGRAIVQEVDLPFSDGNQDLEPYWQQLETAHALFVRTGNIPAPLLRRCHNLQGIVTHGAGVDQVDVSVAESLGIKVINLPGANANAVAELTLGLMLASLRRIPQADRLLRSSGWETSRLPGMELGGKTVGLIGFGQIGRRVAALLQPFNVRLLVTNRSVPAAVGLDYELVSLEELLAASDIVSIHVPLTPDTRHMLNKQRLALLKPGVIIVNTARGAIIEQEALRKALMSGHLAGAALDVFDPEPPATDDPLLRMDNVILTPHLGGSTQECLVELARRGAAAVIELLGL
ncbi:MAG: hydroxyacid dehydrogenase [Firmicutes bacterium]|nr:hydroxyacid dehydrogenase [Bacillota bacterium]